MDNLSPIQRKHSMSSNISRGTSPEKKVRELLRLSKIHFRSHFDHLPGTPDFVLPDRKIALFVNGCFWHSHSCQPVRLPKTNKVYWKKKLARNVSRDKKVKRLLRAEGWRPVIIWECQLSGLTIKRLLSNKLANSS